MAEENVDLLMQYKITVYPSDLIWKSDLTHSGKKGY